MAARANRRAALALAAAWIAGGCGSEDGAPAPGTVVRTSGDTTFAVTTGLGDRSAWRATLVEELSIGALDGPEEEMFGRVSSVAARPDGGVLVYDGQANEIRRFDGDGDFVRRVGRPGEGPGEYQRVNNMLVLPDGRLVINDPGLRRITWYDSAGEYERSVQGWSGLFGGSGSGFAASDDGGSVWVRAPVYPDGNPRNRKDGFVRHGTDGSVDTLITPDFDLDRFATLVGQPGAGMIMTVTTPFGPHGIWSVGGRREQYRARGDRYVLDVLRPDGSILRMESDASPVPVTPPEREFRRNGLLATAHQIDPSWNWSLPAIPDHKPFLKALYLGDRGRIWLHVSTPGESYEAETRDGGTETRWREPILFDVFEADGTYLGVVEPPPGTSLDSFLGDTVWGIYRDDLGVSYAKRFRVEWPGAPAEG